MTDRRTREPATAAVVDDCWNRIGVRGDRSCPELRACIHCRNCDVFAAGAAELLDGAVPTAHLAEWTDHLARPKPTADVEARSIVIFRIGVEWLALPAASVLEVANVLRVHSLPHRKNGVVLGVVNVRGQLLVCVSLGRIVGVDPAAAPPLARGRRTAEYRRLLVIARDEVRVVCPVDEVHGLYHAQTREMGSVPTTLARTGATYSVAVVSWMGRSVGILDDQLLFYSLKRSLA
jgi:chemotaxis-related protein WspD